MNQKPNEYHKELISILLVNTSQQYTKIFEEIQRNGYKDAEFIKAQLDKIDVNVHLIRQEIEKQQALTTDKVF